MARKGKEFELKYKWLYELDQDKYVIKSPAMLYDRASKGKREVDVLVEYKDDEGIIRRISIECRDRKSVVDVTGIEQLSRKKEDLGLDYLVVATTKKFTQGAINKAKYYGVIIEQAEMLDKTSIEKLAKKFYVDFFFLKIELNNFIVITKNHQILQLKNYLGKKNIMEQSRIIKHINEEFYYSIDFNDALQKNNFKMEDFFSNEDNSIVMVGRNELSKMDSLPECVGDIWEIQWKVRAIPYKISLPIEESLSVFDGESHSNKNYRVRFGNTEEFLEIGYLDGKVFTSMKLEPRKYFRFAGAHIELNTVFPEGIILPEPDLDYVINNHLGEFDMSNVLK